MSYVLLALLSALFAALVTITGKIALREVDSSLLAAARATIMAVFLWGYILLNLGSFKQFFVAPKFKELIALLLSALFGALSYLVYFKALQKTPNVKFVQALDRLSIVFVVVLATLVLREKLTIWHIIGSLLMVVGTLMLGGIIP